MNSENLIESYVTAGSLSCAKEKLVDTVSSLMSFIGQTNPSHVVTHSNKAITLKRKKDIFTITLNNYTPPLKLSWSGVIPNYKLEELIIWITQNDKKLAYINNMIAEDLRGVQVAYA